MKQTLILNSMILLQTVCCGFNEVLKLSFVIFGFARPYRYTVITKEFTCFQVWTSSEKHATSISKKHGQLLDNSLTISNIHPKCATNYKKTIPQSISKLPRGKKSKNEPKKRSTRCRFAAKTKVGPKGGTVHFNLRTTH